MAATALAILSQKLITKAAPPSLRELRDLLLTSENYAEFMRIVGEFTPDIEAQVRGRAGAANKMMMFAEEFERRYFPLYPGFAEGLHDDYYELITQIPVVTLSINWDAYSELATGGWRKGLMLAVYILADPYGNVDSPEGERVALADACSQLVRKEDLERVPPGGISHDDVSILLKGTRFEALSAVSDILNFDCGDCFHDNDEEQVSQGGPGLEWTRENVQDITQGWLKAQEIEEKVGKFYHWLEEDLPAHFAELVDFIEDKRRKLRAKRAKSKSEPVFKPRRSDVEWLAAMVRNLSIGGKWIAPMGFTFEKVGENHLRLQKASLSPKLRADALEVINRTVITGKEVGIQVDIDVLEDNMSCPGKMMIGGGNDANKRTPSAPMELAAGAAGGAGPTEGQIRLL
jgi:hypothetical protein